MGKDPPGINDKTLGPLIVILFSTTTVQAVLNVAKGCEAGRPFKEHIPEPFATAHTEFVRTGMFLREEKGISCIIRFVQHSLQLQGKVAGSLDQFEVLDHYTPKPDLGSLQKLPTGITEVDLRKVTMILGDLEVDDITNPLIPEEIKTAMSKEELDILTKAFQSITRLQGNRIKLTCHIRTEAKKLGEWKGVPHKRTYTQRPLPDRMNPENTIDMDKLSYKHQKYGGHNTVGKKYVKKG